MDNQTTVMIADNTEEFCSSLVTTLQRSEGFRVVGTANDGEQAVRMIMEVKPQILVLDLMLVIYLMLFSILFWTPPIQMTKVRTSDNKRYMIC